MFTIIFPINVSILIMSECLIFLSHWFLCLELQWKISWDALYLGKPFHPWKYVFLQSIKKSVGFAWFCFVFNRIYYAKTTAIKTHNGLVKALQYITIEISVLCKQNLISAELRNEYSTVFHYCLWFCLKKAKLLLWKAGLGKSHDSKRRLMLHWF